MIIFRQDQIDVFKNAADAGLERVLAQRLVAAYPRDAARHGEPVIVALVRVGLGRARAFGLDNEDDILKYISAMLLLGGGFEADPLLTWAKLALANPPEAAPRERLATLWERTLAYCERVNGPDNRLRNQALRALEGKTVASLAASAGGSARDLFMFLATVHPQKAKEAGEAALGELGRVAVEACRAQEMLDRNAVIVMTVLMFVFGAGVLTDPLTPWAADALKQTQGKDAARRSAALLGEAAGAAARAN